MEPWRGRDDLPQQLGRHIFVGSDGRVHIFRQPEADVFVEQVLTNIDAAVRQSAHILENYVGIREELEVNFGLLYLQRELELRLPGEADLMRELVSRVAKLAQRFLGPEPLSPAAEELLRRQILGLLDRLGAVRNPHKVAARDQLRAVVQLPLFDERGRADVAVAEELSEAAGDLLDRFTDIARKFAGVTVQQQILLREKRRCEELLASGYRLIGSVLYRLLNQQEVGWGEIGRLCGQISPAEKDGTLLAALAGIYVNPYRERVTSKEVRRLRLLPELLEAGNKDALTGVLRAAFLKLRAPVQLAADRDRPAGKRWVPIA